MVFCACATGSKQTAIDWPAYGHDSGGTHYSPARQIDRSNVGRLEVAWTYRTGDYGISDGAARSESNPIVVDGTLYVTTPYGRVIALDPDTGRERWNFDPQIDLHGDYGDFTNRGVSTWVDSQRRIGDACRRTIFVAPVDARLIALDAATGARCSGFGANGEVDLQRGLVNTPDYKGEYAVTSPPAVIGDAVIVGSSVADNHRIDAPEGVVRAFDARSGRLLWQWDPIARGPRGMRVGAANAWSIISTDAQHSLVFVPTGSASPDYYGGERPGDNRYANSLVALDAQSGRMRWAFQFVHHDLWDFDVPAEPMLVDLDRNGQRVPVVVQPTKMGELFVFNRLTGEPLFPIEERPVPASDVPGEVASATQPFSSITLVPTKLSAADAFGLTDSDRAGCRATLEQLRNEGFFTPPSLKGTVMVPGNVGGSNWSGIAFDPVRQMIVAPVNNLPAVVTLIPRDQLSAALHGPRTRFDEFGRQVGAPYAMRRQFLINAAMVPCTPPPWGMLVAVDLHDGSTKWRRPYGVIAPLAAAIPQAAQWGSPNLGGVIVTGSGIGFGAGALDQKMYAFDVEDGRDLWSTTLPAGGNALPMTFVSPKTGKQYVVISAGGHKDLRTKLGDFVIAYALPDGKTQAAVRTDLSGTWSGQLIPGRSRHSIKLVLPDGTFEITNLNIRAKADVKTTPAGVDLRIPFEYPAKSCSGVIGASLALANNGAMLVGEGEIRSNCSDSGVEPSTFALRRVSGH